jgi:hypothetical protein
VAHSPVPLGLGTSCQIAAKLPPRSFLHVIRISFTFGIVFSLGRFGLHLYR